MIGNKAEKGKIIAIDGYSSCGKSTFARLIAQKLGYVFIDTGAMYRAVTLFAIQNSVPVDELPMVLGDLNIEFRYNEKLERSEIYLNDQNVDSAIRSLEVNELVSQVAKIAQVRQKLVDSQRKIGLRGGVVMDGRDIGTVVFPEADLKIFMTAGVEVRAKRRYNELRGAVTLEQVAKNIADRDYADENREESPLRKAADAVVLDNSNMTLDQQMEWFSDLFGRLCVD